jgi:hypothetical protein
MKTVKMMLSASCVTNFSQMTSMVKYGFNGQNVKSGAIQFAEETTLLVTAIFVTFTLTDKFLKTCLFRKWKESYIFNTLCHLTGDWRNGSGRITWNVMTELTKRTSSGIFFYVCIKLIPTRLLFKKIFK